MTPPAEPAAVDVQKLERELSRFGGSDAERRAVARAAGDLTATGRYADDVGAGLDAETVLAELSDARDGSPADRWNWWLGALEVAYGGYREFQVERWSEG